MSTNFHRNGRMHARLAVLLLLVSLQVVLVLQSQCVAQSTPRAAHARVYLGFDRNDYPGDDLLAELHRSFAFTGYWLNNPPGQHSNSWRGKRKRLEREGFGFLLLYNGRSYAQLKGLRTNPGAGDGELAARAAREEGFHSGSILFLDQEEGGRMLEVQRNYVFAWAEAVRRAGYRPGIYCSGIEVTEGDGTVISTARHLHALTDGSKLVYWVANDACPPSPGCTTTATVSPETSGAPFAEVWQYAQSPMRKKVSQGCPALHNHDGDCMAPGIDAARRLHLDLNSARTPDPSQTRP